MFNWIDVAVLIVVGLYVWRGWREGFLRSAVDLIGLALIASAGLRFYAPVASWLETGWGVPTPYGLALGFLIAGIAAMALFWMLAGLFLAGLPWGVHGNWLNRLAGALPGLMAGILAATVLVTVVRASPLEREVGNTIDASPLGAALTSAGQRVSQRLEPILGPALAETLNFFTVEPDSEAMIRLPHAAAGDTARPTDEEQMLAWVNDERRAAGLPPLVMDERLRQLARQHSQDMLRRAYFSHYTPDGLSPFDRMRAARIPFSAAGENLAEAPTLGMAHRGLMNSPGHRANILSPSFGRVGIGVIDGGDLGLMISQEFTN
ncbi:MAG: CvpA family protein [Anaerolineae bacterium]